MRQIYQKHIVLFSLVISTVMLGIDSVFSWDQNPIMGLDKLCADSLIVLCCMGIIQYMGLWEQAGFNKEGYKKGLLLGSPFIVIGIASIFVSNAGIDWGSIKHISIGNTVLFTLNMILVGANEEIWMRSLVLNGLIKKYGNSRQAIAKAIVISALIFGAIHIPNLFFMHPITVIVQVVNAASAGALFGVIYLLSKNIWAGITIHALVDWLSLFIGNCFTGASTVLSVEMNITQAIFIILAGSMPPILIAIWLLRRYDCSRF